MNATVTQQLEDLRMLVVTWQYDRDCPAKVVAEIDRMLATGKTEPQSEPVAYKVWHPKNPKCSYVGAEPPSEFRADTGEPDEYFGGRVVPLYAAPQAQHPQPTFNRGDRVRKRSGSAWQGRVVGEYCTTLTPDGYAVESDAHPGSVQIYPAKALENMPKDSLT
jgi:dihydrofolate reductase (trimethoprim resistance protein)